MFISVINSHLNECISDIFMFDAHYLIFSFEVCNIILMSYVMIKYFNIGFHIRAIPLIIKINMYVVIEMLENSQFSILSISKLFRYRKR